MAFMVFVKVVKFILVPTLELTCDNFGDLPWHSWCLKTIDLKTPAGHNIMHASGMMIIIAIAVIIINLIAVIIPIIFAIW